MTSLFCVLVVFLLLHSFQSKDRRAVESITCSGFTWKIAKCPTKAPPENSEKAIPPSNIVEKKFIRLSHRRQAQLSARNEFITKRRMLEKLFNKRWNKRRAEIVKTFHKYLDGNRQRIIY